MSYITLKRRWCNINVLNVHAPTEDNSDDTKECLYKELERVLDQFPKYDMKILLGDCNAKVEGQDISKLAIGNESLHKLVIITGTK
jgi:hypothetical protein